jgi:hypothetical protein
MSEDSDLIHWQGKLEQPNVHYLYRSFLNAVDGHKLPVGPRSVSGVCVGSLPFKLCLSFLAIAETNVFLLYARHHKLTSDQYSHADFKVDSEELLKRAHKSAVDVDEQDRVTTRRSRESDSGVDTGDPKDPQRHATQVQGEYTGAGFEHQSPVHDVWLSH